MRLATLLLFFVLPAAGFAQFAVSFHQSNLPFAGFSYEIKNRIRPEIRIGVDNDIESIPVEAVVVYDLLKKEDYEFYAGLGVWSQFFTGVVVPVGINVYPLPFKQFGFHIELAPIINDGALLRGSWGIRYKFKKKRG